MPEIRPFRALRFEPDVVGDLAAVVSPPYDVISPALQRELVARHPKNVVRLDLPLDELGDGSFHVMPQKSTYFYPKPVTGLVINPHEW